jgi:hypothetical protein
LFSQQEAAFEWIERTNVHAWVKIVQPLFAYLNHEDSFVRDTFKSLIEKIGTFYPHAICYPAFVRAAFTTEQNEDDAESRKIVSNQVRTFESLNTEFILELRDKRNLRRNRGRSAFGASSTGC